MPILQFLSGVEDVRPYMKKLIENNQLSYPRAMKLMSEHCGDKNKENSNIVEGGEKEKSPISISIINNNINNIIINPNEQVQNRFSRKVSDTDKIEKGKDKYQINTFRSGLVTRGQSGNNNSNFNLKSANVLAKSGNYSSNYGTNPSQLTITTSTSPTNIISNQLGDKTARQVSVSKNQNGLLRPHSKHVSETSVANTYRPLTGLTTGYNTSRPGSAQVAKDRHLRQLSSNSMKDYQTPQFQKTPSNTSLSKTLARSYSKGHMTSRGQNPLSSTAYINNLKSSTGSFIRNIEVERNISNNTGTSNTAQTVRGGKSSFNFNSPNRYLSEDKHNMTSRYRPYDVSRSSSLSKPGTNKI